MKIKISKQIIYLLGLSIILLILVLLFSFLVLVPQGKEYRIKRSIVKKQNLELRQLKDFEFDSQTKLKKLTSDNKHVIGAFKNKFDEKRFEKQYKKYFQSLKLSKRVKQKKQDTFNVYDVNTTSSINSPKNFYDFLDAVNKSDWIIKINFPIDFQRDSEAIKSSFTIQVYYRD